ncbi:MAG: dienelactone hydrolase family protein [Rhodocyclaceae bacterium]|nr:dienelactone hydrolase family protein [Rhodocyclaceae bacterium]MBP6110285.1 dienelactone hydrolase family protein [Rhodocyclaceae bacterium]MBP6279491.1 dienelactone hydrolase family protein [Rhodocyclaceae bacterium]
MNQSQLESELSSLHPAETFDRRSFLVTSLGAGFALAVQPIVAQSAITTDSEGLIAGEMKVPVADGEMVAYRAAPMNAKGASVVLVVSEIFGAHEYIRDVCRRLAKLGYIAIAPELFARYGDPRSYTSIPDLFANVVSKADDAVVMSDLDACVAWAGKNGGDTAKLAITGFCWGGRITWLYAAHNPKVAAAVAWYGKLDGNPTKLQPDYPIDLVAKIKTPVLGLYGAADQGIPLTDVNAMRQALEKQGSKSQIHVYDGVGHAFHADYRPSYRKTEAIDGWQRMLAWFRNNGV